MVSKQAEACPSCGRRFRSRWFEIRPSIVLLLFIVFLISMVAPLWGSDAPQDDLIATSYLPSRIA
jgi:hypothetical protein